MELSSKNSILIPFSTSSWMELKWNVWLYLRICWPAWFNANFYMRHILELAYVHSCLAGRDSRMFWDCLSWYWRWSGCGGPSTTTPPSFRLLSPEYCFFIAHFVLWNFFQNISIHKFPFGHLKSVVMLKECRTHYLPGILSAFHRGSLASAVSMPHLLHSPALLQHSTGVRLLLLFQCRTYHLPRHSFSIPPGFDCFCCFSAALTTFPGT